VTPSDLRDSTSSKPDETIRPNARGFQINVHLIPPQPQSDTFDRYLPKRPGTTATLVESDVIRDKILHPEHYV